MSACGADGGAVLSPQHLDSLQDPGAVGTVAYRAYRHFYITQDLLEACRLSHRLHVLAGQTTWFLTAMDFAGEPTPPPPDNPALQKSQGALLRQLLRRVE